MHQKAKQRIVEKIELEDTRPEFKLPKKGDAYLNFKNGIERLCEEMIESDISEENRTKIIWLKSRINIEL